MNAINIFLPIIMALFYFLLIFFIPIGSFLVGGAISLSIFKDGKNNKYNDTYLKLDIDKFIKIFSIGLMILFFVCYFALFNFLSSAWIRATPSVEYDKQAKDASSIVVFGFGLGREKNNKPTPGKANLEIHDWLKTNSNNRLILGQYGNLLAEDLNPTSNTFVLMHDHNPNNYVNTFDAAGFALNKLDSLFNQEKINKNIILLAHDMQLQRVSWIFDRLSKKKNEWQKFNFIIPDIPKMSFSHHSSHFHTKGRFIYNCVEIFYSRPRDYFLGMRKNY